MARSNKGCPSRFCFGPTIIQFIYKRSFYLINESDVCYYADDNTLHASDISLNLLMEKLESAARKAIDWFEQNGMKVNPKNCHPFISNHKYEQMIANIGNTNIIESHSVKLM